MGGEKPPSRNKTLGRSSILQLNRECGRKRNPATASFQACCFGRFSPSGLNAIVISSAAVGEEVMLGVKTVAVFGS